MGLFNNSERQERDVLYALLAHILTRSKKMTQEYQNLITASERLSKSKFSRKLILEGYEGSEEDYLLQLDVMRKVLSMIGEL